jgi:hypothetical protein
LGFDVTGCALGDPVEGRRGRVILRDGPDRLKVGAASSERSRLLEMFAVAVDAGPCIECVRTGSRRHQQ